MQENTPKKMERWRQHLTRYADFGYLLKGLLERGHTRVDTMDHQSLTLHASDPPSKQLAELAKLQELATTVHSEEALANMLNDLVEHSRSVSVSESRKSASG